MFFVFLIKLCYICVTLFPSRLWPFDWTKQPSRPSLQSPALKRGKKAPPTLTGQAWSHHTWCTMMLFCYHVKVLIEIKNKKWNPHSRFHLYTIFLLFNICVILTRLTNLESLIGLQWTKATVNDWKHYKISIKNDVSFSKVCIKAWWHSCFFQWVSSASLAFFKHVYMHHYDPLIQWNWSIIKPKRKRRPSNSNEINCNSFFHILSLFIQLQTSFKFILN